MTSPPNTLGASTPPASKQSGMDTSALVESIYRISLEPHAYDDFMEQWESHISKAVETLRDLQSQAEKSNSNPYVPEIEKHFEIGFRLLEELGRSSLASYFGDDEDLGGAPRMLINAKGNIVWFNGRAANLFNISRSTHIDMLNVEATSQTVLVRLLDGLQAANKEPVRSAVVRIMSSGEGRPVYLLSKPTRDRNDENLLLLEELSVGWPAGMDRMLTDAFRLSQAELEIAALIAEGFSALDVATQRGSSLATVRTQIKKILGKTGARGQADLVRVLHAMIRVCETEEPERSKAKRIAPKRTVLVRNRAMPVEILGAPDGDPIVMMHGMLDGCVLSRDMHKLLMQHGLKMVAPTRPWFGEAEGDKGAVPSAMTRFAEDVEAMCDEFKIDRPVLMGHMAGSLYAFATAARMGDRVRGIVNVSGGVPIISQDQFRAMSRRQRLVAYTARYTPSLLPFILRAGIRQLDYGGEKNFANALYENSEFDRAALENPEVFDIVRAGYHFTVAQGHRAFETDAYHVVRDWTEMLEASRAPVICIHGAHDPVVTIQSVRDFAARYPERVTLQELSDTGQLVLYRKPDTVVRALETMMSNRQDFPTRMAGAAYRK